MPKNRTYPDCFDEAPQLTITSLKKAGYFRTDSVFCRIHCWSYNGEPLLRVKISFYPKKKFADLDYLIGRKPINYRINLERIPAHFGGYNWYFICPETGKRCRTLYAIRDKFLSRFAYPSAMYSKQTESKSNRGLFSSLISSYRIRDYLDEPHARTMYKGKPTKRYARMVAKSSGLFIKHVPVPDDLGKF